MTPALHFTQFGRYEIIRKLGRSMTDVYLALDPETNRRVVLKIVEHSRDSYTQLVVEAERRGAMIQQQLHSKDPRILEVFDYGDQNGCFFVAMQYAEGHNLAEFIRKENRLEAVRAARLAAEICSQLETLHSFEADIDGQKRAVVHGDIKPSNIQIGLDGEVWLLDFGIAKVITATRNLTRHNLGSPAYCSPERLKSGNVDPQSDLWAVGVCLYEMIAGLPPYQAQTTRKLENLIQSRRPPRALPEDCPPGMRSIIRMAIAADPARRYPTAGSMARDLRAFAEGKRPPVAEAQHREPSWDANATVERSPAPSSAPTSERRPLAMPAIPPHRVAKISDMLAQFSVVAWSLIAGLIIGLICFVPASHLYRFWNRSAPLRANHDYRRIALTDIDKEWTLYRDLKRGYDYLGRWSPAAYLTGPMRSRLSEAGDQIFDEYLFATDSGISQYDWDKARECFAHAVEADPGSADVKGKLATATGFVELLKTPPAARNAEAKFHEAVALAPRLALPHLGLARIYIYEIRNLGLASAEFSAAERVGYHLGPREKEQQADAFLRRGEQEFREWQNAATDNARRHYANLMQRDLDRARALYEPIAGYSKATDSLERVAKLETAYLDASKPKPAPHPKKTTRYTRRWH